MFPEDWIGGGFPFLEDLANPETFAAWRRFEECNVVNPSLLQTPKFTGQEAAALGRHKVRSTASINVNP